MTLSTVLFDLDGTLADTARDLGSALNALRTELGFDAVSLQYLRPYTSAGTRGMLLAGLDLQPEDADYSAMAERFLALYAQRLCVETVIFPDLLPVLEILDERRIRWGVVTNKPKRFTQPLMEALGVAHRCACIVSGDSAVRPKPAADPLLLAAELLQVAPETVLYAGDDPRDITAGLAAGMRTVAVGWGYLGVNAVIDNWGADWVIQEPDELIPILDAR